MMDRYEGPHSALTIELHRSLYLDIVMDRQKGPHISLTIVLLRGL
jgi:hypothetical protein